LSNTLPAHLRNLAPYLQTDEQIRLTIPGIWVVGRTSQQSEQQQGQEEQGEQANQSRSTTCDIILTNQRLIGYTHIRFPRERLFLESFPLQALTVVSLRQKSHEPCFREVLVSDGQRRAYIRSSRQKIEQLYAALHPLNENSASNAPIEPETTTDEDASETTTETTPSSQPAMVYGRQDIRRTFDQSPLGITVLFIGGLLLEILGVLLWSTTHSAQIGLPLCIAGFACVIAATTQRRRHRL